MEHTRRLSPFIDVKGGVNLSIAICWTVAANPSISSNMREPAAHSAASLQQSSGQLINLLKSGEWWSQSKLPAIENHTEEQSEETFRRGNTK